MKLEEVLQCVRERRPAGYKKIKRFQRKTQRRKEKNRKIDVGAVPGREKKG